MLKPDREVGIVGYGAYVPRYRLPAEEVARVWGDVSGVTPITEKAVAGLDEDTISMSIEASRNALARAGIDPQGIRAVWIGSESHPYAVKPSSTIVAEAIGAAPSVQAADLEFACKAGSEAVVAGIGIVGSGMGRYVLAIGMDTAQGRPGDALEYTAASGGAAFILGPAEESLAAYEATLSHVSDTPDFWRRAYAHYPSHGHRFTGEPAYFEHITSAGRRLMEEMGTKPSDYAYAVFHQPNAKFPQRAAQILGFSKEQIKTGLLSPKVGNVYAGSSMLGLTAVLDVSKPGDRILLASFGSGAGSDAFSFVITERIQERQGLAPSTQAYVARRKAVDYALYARYRKVLQMH